MSPTIPTKRPVVVTTEHRGVFFGYTDDPDEASLITLSEARMAVYYSAETRGILGLAKRGPQPGSRITSAVEQICLRGITAVMVASEDAVKAWESEPWS